MTLTENNSVNEFPIITPPSTSPRRRRRAKVRRSERRPGPWTYILILALSAFFIGPFIWLVLAALKTPAEWASLPVKILPEQAQWENFAAALNDANFFGYAGNSLFLATTYSILITLSSAAVGFGFARLRAPGKKALFLIVLATMMIPQILTLLPTYILFSRIGLINTYWPWVLWGLAASPYMVFLFRQYFSSLPKELEDAAIIDGAGWFRIFATIFLPLSRPILITSFLLSFTWTWGDYIAPALLLNLDNTTLAVAITAFYQDPNGNTIPTVQAAAGVMYIIPVLLIFFFMQRYFIQSNVSSGIKG
ncbi:carbohydrate ABC transporter permease [Microbacterium sp. EYE_5]|uniref:carbohydrate ABC transporter permease n=1 Tax=unclassified Microbacterium TaxID=2609290 RepID=UPI00200606D8|nr:MULTISPECIES: carbohydrate ABC transporter permease [unclassified Microbacterium]MCK6079398.1 carbohydrate ABC transporter permease [Microbacterium sp. EYE_382]MCK6084668.1 carbohydrate ABC transporter permease [Microbacterium sp. EYE_384]MCK6123103.1 carbohydrate ABC transporter permease [Microbacterium sp. EYE_80]MCK6125432.1 carbohydrate ABC transporter permease [Microbacterium sp. EYE_79]MCK6140352.1 carbohydrate ABC transporter permease [Microbacterium sp. EYE_39]